MNQLPWHPAIVDDARRKFLARFGCSPSWVAVAPGRVNLIGDHVDYNDGYVLPFAIDKYTVAMGAPGSAPYSTIVSEDQEAEGKIFHDHNNRPADQGWIEYVKGVFHGFHRRGIEVPIMNVMVCSEIPIGSGLSSSAALEVAIATLLESASGCTLEPLEKSRLCQAAEHEFAGVPCGLMDQFASEFSRAGHLLMLDCRSNEYQLIPFDSSEVCLLVTNTHVRHALASSQYPRRRAQCESAAEKLGLESLRDLTLEHLHESKSQITETEFRRAKHVVSEINRTREFVTHFRQRDWEAAGKLMFASHRSLCDEFEVSCPELDKLVELAADMGTEKGIWGSRMTGGGFGGCTVSLVKAALAESVMEELVERYRASKVSSTCASAFLTQPARGAYLIS